MGDGIGDYPRVGVVTAEDDLGRSLARLIALAGGQPIRAVASAEVRAVWRSTRVVVVGSDLAPVVAAAGLPRRGGVVVVALVSPDDALWEAVVEIGATRLLTLPDDDARLVDCIAEGLDGTSATGATIAVVGGCGGAGASTFAASLAITSARGAPTFLIDGDPLGGGIDVMLGAEGRPGARWSDLRGTQGTLAASALTEAVLHVGDLAVLSWDRSASVDIDPGSITAVLKAAVRGCAAVVIDLPRSWAPATLALAAAADLVVMVVPATVRAAAAAAAVSGWFQPHGVTPSLVVRDPGAAGLSVAAIGDALGLPIIASVRSEPGVVRASRRGDPPISSGRGSLASACRAVLSATHAAVVAA